jgi:hypothetical protein
LLWYAAIVLWLRWTCIVVIAGCGPAVSSGEPEGASSGEALEGGDPESSGSTSGGSGVGSSADVTTVPGTSAGATVGSTSATTGVESTSGESSGSEVASDATSGAQPPVDPTVWTVYTDTMSGPEVSAFEELERHAVGGDEAQCSACGGGSAPELDAPFLWVNGAFAPNDTIIHVGDRVGVLFAFADADCDIACGAENSWVATPNGESSGGGWIGSDAPCDTASTNVYGGLDFYEVDDPGEYVVHHMRFDDVCGEQGSVTEFSFTVDP